MRVEQIMTANPIVVDATRPVVDAARQMRGHGVGVLPVISNGALVGVVTDRDITERVVAAGRSAADTPVAAVVTQGAVTCHPEDDIEVAIDRMVAGQVKRIVVVDKRDGHVVGLLSVDDLALIPEHAPRTLAVLQKLGRRWREVERQGALCDEVN
jgi:CBS domain-containing protein